MAQLKDLLVNGVSRLIGDVFIQKINAPTATGGTTFGPGTSGQVLKTNGSTIYWGEDSVNAGTVTSVQVAATSPVVSSTGTASSSSLSTTISLADGYGDTKNPYASKTKNYVLASPNGSNGTPSFRALFTSDLPISNIAASSILMTASTATDNLVVRSVTDASANTAIAGSTNIPTMNTIYYGLVQVNGASQTRATTIYVPTSAGNASQLLISGGSSNAPSWLTAGTDGQILKTTSSGIAWSDSIVDSLTTARSIDGANFDGSADVVHYGICYTAANTAAKVVNKKTTSSADPEDQAWVGNFTLKKGSIFYIKFTNGNTATGNITLNINGTGAKAIYNQNNARVGLTSGYQDYLVANKVYQFIYDGTNYILVNVPGELELFEKRGSTTNLNTLKGTLGGMCHIIQTDSTTTTETNGKLPVSSAHVLQMNWDNSSNTNHSQFAIGISGTKRAFFRSNTLSNANGTWQEIAHAPVSTDSTGSDTRPVYMASNGTITPIDGPIATTYGGTGVSTATNHTVFAGPVQDPNNPDVTSGTPSFRQLTANDIVDLPSGLDSITSYVDTNGDQYLEFNSDDNSIELPNIISANRFFAGPSSGSAGTPCFRKIMDTDILGLGNWKQIWKTRASVGYSSFDSCSTYFYNYEQSSGTYVDFMYSDMLMKQLTTLEERNLNYFLVVYYARRSSGNSYQVFFIPVTYLFMNTNTGGETDVIQTNNLVESYTFSGVLQTYAAKYLREDQGTFYSCIAFSTVGESSYTLGFSSYQNSGYLTYEKKTSSFYLPIYAVYGQKVTT